MSCLDFPGAIFVGIHDDGTPNGLAAVVRKSMPEDSTIVDLDSGSVDCSGDRYVFCFSTFVMESDARSDGTTNRNFIVKGYLSSTALGALSRRDLDQYLYPRLRPCAVMLVLSLAKSP
jgi:hypothetical protein